MCGVSGAESPAAPLGLMLAGSPQAPGRARCRVRVEF